MSILVTGIALTAPFITTAKYAMSDIEYFLLPGQMRFQQYSKNCGQFHKIIALLYSFPEFF